MTRQILFTATAFGLYGLSKVVFNYAAIQRLDASTVGDLNALLALQTVLVLFVGQPIAAVVHRFTPEYLASNRERMARGLLTAGFAVTLIVAGCIYLILRAGQALVLRRVSIADESLYIDLLPYVVGYAVYFFFKMAYYGFQRIGEYCLAETVACASFFATLAYAASLGRPAAFVWPWLIHPIVFIGFALWHFRGDFVWPSGGRAGGTRVGRYVRFGGFWLTSAASGLGAYHVSILLAKLFVDDPEQVGYYAVALSLMTPLTFLPITLSMVLFPQMTTNFATGAVLRNAALLRAFTAVLLAAMGAVTMLLLGFAPEILTIASIPRAQENILVIQVLCVGVAIALCSMPSGTFLSATRFAGTAAAIGLATLAFGIAGWLALVPLLGIVGVALGYTAIMGAKGVANLLTANHHVRWYEGGLARFWMLPLSMVLAGALGLSDLSLYARLLILSGTLAVVVLSQFSVLRSMYRSVMSGPEISG